MNALMLKLVVDDLEASIPVYTALFGTGPDRCDPRHAHWALDNPQLDVTLTHEDGKTPGLASLGLRYDDMATLTATRERLAATGRHDFGGFIDPAGIVWAGLAEPAADGGPQSAPEVVSPFVRHRREQRRHFYTFTPRPEGRM